MRCCEVEARGASTRRVLSRAWMLVGSVLAGLQLWHAFTALGDGYLPLPLAGAALVTAHRSTEPVLFHVMLALLMLAALAIAVSVLRIRWSATGAAQPPQTRLSPQQANSIGDQRT